ncbi:hypothetical protein KI387_031326, partial [Taxus chinensis]
TTSKSIPVALYLILENLGRSKRDLASPPSLHSHLQACPVGPLSPKKFISPQIVNSVGACLLPPSRASTTGGASRLRLRWISSPGWLLPSPPRGLLLTMMMKTPPDSGWEVSDTGKDLPGP